MRLLFLSLVAVLTDSATALNHTKVLKGSCSRVAENALSAAERCSIAKSDDCDNRYVAAYYCAHSAGVRGVVCVGCVLWMVLLFVLLGSTADEYFSPALEQFSADAGLPPRFAGVTLLALGNGAPDVSSTMHAVRTGQYRMALGALTGAGMFVGTVVTGAVMMYKQPSGETRAQGALIRDVSAYAATAALVMGLLARGSVDAGVVTLLLCCYAAFVLVVLAADLWHRRPGGPFETRANATEEDGEPPAIELLLTLLHSVRRPDHHSRPAINLASSSVTTPMTTIAASSTSYERQRSPYVVIDGDDPLGSMLGLVEEEAGAPLSERLLDDSEAPVVRVRDENVVAELCERSQNHLKVTILEEPFLPWRILALAEAPFVAMRRATVPLTATDSYARAPLLLSLLFAPLWLVVYTKHSYYPPFRPSLLALSCGVFASSIAWWLTGQNRPLQKTPALVLALFGFLCAATWIDVFAGQLVSTLEFFGVLAAIPEPALGLTVLAWGNSVGDLSTNLAMAKKGLANMAITACFAGPVFNMLVGLGVGFSLWLKEENAVSLPVKLNAGLKLGFVMIVVNCLAIVLTGLANNFKIPRNFAVFSLAFYALYIALSLGLLFS